MGAPSEVQETEETVSVASLTDAYRVRPGVYDEMMDPDGAIRAHWRPLLEGIAGLGSEEAAARFAAADRYLRDSGVFYRVYDDAGAAERPWALSHLPLLISAADWRHIQDGALQRVALVEAILEDIYGGQRFVGEGWLPAAAIAGSGEYLRPLVGAAPPGGRYLGFYAIDLGRSPNGEWWVIRDRAQAPSGAGYALENRAALSRALSDIYRNFGVERLGGFFDGFRRWLTGFHGADDAGVCLLTPGRMNETYFEHAYLARHLGLRLVEGQDLTVRDQRVYLRTIAGLRPISALWRRVDADFCDPLELNQRSQLGVPGLVQAIRHGNIALANALGAGVAEAQSLMSFLPALAKTAFQQTLVLPNVATWWCGQEAERSYVLDHLDELAVAPAFARPKTGILAAGPVAGAEMAAAERAALVDQIARRGIDYVGQELVELSTTPVWVDGRLEPRPFMLRVYVAASAEGWRVMPGGLALVGDSPNARALTMQSGARSADVWVLSETEAKEPTSSLAAGDATIRRARGALPSRAADNLFWLARYLERAELTLRVVRVLAARLSEGDRDARIDTAGLVEILFIWGAIARNAPGEAAEAAIEAMFDNRHGSVTDLIRSARNAAAVIRDRFPGDALRALDELNLYVLASSREAMTEGYVLEKANMALRNIAAIIGLQQENMNRLSGWRFLQLGHRIERAIGVCRFVRQFASEKARPDSLDILLDLTESRGTYRVRYQPGAMRAPVLDLVLLDEANPRSLAFAVADIVSQAAALPNPRPGRLAAPASRLAESLLAEVRGMNPAAVASEQLIGIENGLMRLSNEVARSYFNYREPASGGSVQ